MSYNKDDLATEVREVCDDLTRDGFVPKEWIIAAVMKRHPGIDGPDRDFALYTAHFCVTKSVEAHFRQIKANETADDKQMIIQGFKHLKESYLIEREGTIGPVALIDMSRAECYKKVGQLERIGRGALEHARELRRWADEKFSGQNILSTP